MHTSVGTFASESDVNRATAALRELGLTETDLEVEQAPSDSTPSTAPGRNSLAAGAASGAGFGGLVGALVGWLSGAGVLQVAPLGGTLSGENLTSTVAGLAVGAGLGALIGTLIGLLIPEARGGLRLSRAEYHILFTVHGDEEMAAQVERALWGNGALDVQTQPALPVGEEAEVAAKDGESLPQDLPGSQEAETLSALQETASHQEGAKAMDDEARGVDPDTVTGTSGALDPSTGAFGTAGTPLTTGYGVSGSTVGIGSDAGEAEQLSRDFVGETPDSTAYSMGGRGSGDAERQTGEAHSTRVTDRFAAQEGTDGGTLRARTDAPDVYEAGPSYENDAGLAPDESPADLYSSSAVDEPPSYSQMSGEEAHESAGTNIPGTADPRGLGDNTDEPGEL